MRDVLKETILNAMYEFLEINNIQLKVEKKEDNDYINSPTDE